MSSKSYSEFLRDPKWQRKRLSIFERDDFTCRDCGEVDKQLHVHHCFYERGKPWETDDRFLLTLCSDCHEKRQSLESDIKRAIGFICAYLANKEGDDESLTYFTRSAVSMANDIQEGQQPSPTLACEYELDYRSDGRWFNAAYGDKRFRKCYEYVTGRKVKWRNK